ncbi:MAG: hypothetical protein GKS01_05710 [Alphaproteobacteria bacterium]|nr:hypothetical protein [Alphaproteobacteria bacterium]
MAPNKLTRGLTGVLVPAARQKGIPVYSVSNSIDIVLLGAEGYKDVDPGQLDHFDRQIVVNNYRRTYLERTGHDLNRIVVAGSPRSCVEWTKFRRQTNAIQPVEVEDSEGRLKILVFGRTPEPCLTDDYIATLNKIAELDFVKIVLKLKPQSDFTASYLTELDKNIVLRSDRDTFQFSLWADVALGITTTALIEPMMLNIPIIDLGHLRVLPTNYASAGACWSSNSASHLVDLLHKLHSEYPPSSYPWDIVESYLQENVVAEAPNGDVLGYHEKLLVTDPATVQ